MTKAPVQRTRIDPQPSFYGTAAGRLLFGGSQGGGSTQYSDSDDRNQPFNGAPSCLSFPDADHPKANERMIEFEIDGVQHRVLINLDQSQATAKVISQEQGLIKNSEHSQKGHYDQQQNSQKSIGDSPRNDRNNIFFNHPKLASLKKPSLQEVCQKIIKNSPSKEFESEEEDEPQEEESSSSSLGKRLKKGDPEKFGFMTAHKLVQLNAQYAQYDENPHFVNPALLDFDSLPPMDPLNTFFDCEVVYSDEEPEQKKKKDDLASQEPQVFWLLIQMKLIEVILGGKKAEIGPKKKKNKGCGAEL